jgi:hypothetical protein
LPPQVPLQQSAAAAQPASLAAQTQLPPEQTPLQHWAFAVQVRPSRAQQAWPPSAASQSRPGQHAPAPGVQAVPIQGQQPPQRQFSPLAQLAAQPLPALGQQTEPRQLPWQQSELAWQARPAEVQLAATVLGPRPEPSVVVSQQATSAAVDVSPKARPKASQARALRFTRTL